MDISKIVFTGNFDYSKYRYYTCPRCGKKLEINDCTVMKVRTSCKNIKTSVGLRKVTHTYLETYYNIRYCKKCAKVKTIRRKILLYVFYLLLPMCLILLIDIKNNWHVPFWDIIGLFFATIFFVGMAHGIINWISMGLGLNLDLEHARECNAITI